MDILRKSKILNFTLIFLSFFHGFETSERRLWRDSVRRKTTISVPTSGILSSNINLVLCSLEASHPLFLREIKAGSASFTCLRRKESISAAILRMMPYLRWKDLGCLVLSLHRFAKIAQRNMHFAAFSYPFHPTNSLVHMLLIILLQLHSTPVPSYCDFFLPHSRYKASWTPQWNFFLLRQRKSASFILFVPSFFFPPWQSI